MVNISGNIGEIAESTGYRQIRVRRTSWGESYAIVEKLHFKCDGDKYPNAYGFCKFSNGSEKRGKIDNAGTFSWILVKILEGDLKLIYISTD